MKVSSWRLCVYLFRSKCVQIYCSFTHWTHGRFWLQAESRHKIKSTHITNLSFVSPLIWNRPCFRYSASAPTLSPTSPIVHVWCRVFFLMSCTRSASPLPPPFSFLLLCAADTFSLLHLHSPSSSLHLSWLLERYSAFWSFFSSCIHYVFPIRVPFLPDSLISYVPYCFTADIRRNVPYCFPYLTSFRLCVYTGYIMV